ncbi:protein FRA10AC1 homolog [Pomacea canaliculata]|uniref:protein FRA10AC1 homolog n=1 Tax=Pomacea canaliculata TaxID=400727 RepID=UPI000D72A5EE|nr:protein FRA10AC1 homolog [Pomacea canaliculata]
MSGMADRIDFTELGGSGYSSELDSDAETKKRKQHDESLLSKKKARSEKLPDRQEMGEMYNKEEGKIHRVHYLTMSAFDRHKQYVNNYVLYFGGSMNDFYRDRSKDKTDLDVIRENHRFLWSDDDDADITWEKQLAKKYYDKLFKEYCLADLSRYKENKIGMRWRTEKEVVDGKGQFICGNKKCAENEGLRSWEVNFAYMEHGEKKNALVKLRLCPDCSYKLNYHHKKREIVQKKKSKREEKDKLRAKDQHDLNEVEGQKQSSTHPGEKVSSSESPSDSSIWSAPIKLTEEKSREEEFDDYFADMFL